MNFTLIKPAFAQITNPAVGELGSSATEASSGVTFLKYLVTIWQSIISVGAIMVILYLVWGGIEWISAGGDSSKVQKARDRMTQAVIGMIILAGTFAIIEFISRIFFGEDFNILQLRFLTPNSSGTP